MRDLALAILGRHAEKQIQNALACSEAQAHRIIQHDKCPEHLLPRLVEYLESALTFAEGRLGAAKDDLRSIRAERMVSRAQGRRMATRRQSPETPDPSLPGLFEEWPRKPSVNE